MNIAFWIKIIRAPDHLKRMEFTSYFIVYIGLTFLVNASNGAKILGIFPLPAKSHFTCDNAVMKSLIDAGHEVTVVTSFPKQASQENYTSIVDVSEEKHIFISRSDFSEFTTQNVFRFINITSDMEYPYCSKVINSPEMRKILRSNEKLYDVLFVEVLLFYKCFLPIAEKMQIPVIGVVTLRTWAIADHAILNPYNPVYIPFEPLTQKWHLRHIFGRIINALNYVVILWHKNFVMPKLLGKFHEDNVDQLGALGKYKNMEPEIIFFNNHASYLPRPMNPNAIDIGGIHMKNYESLPKVIQKFIDEAQNGVVLFTFGSVLRAATMSENIRNAFRDAFAEIPQRVIWKFEEKIENLSDNVLLLDWLPQRDVLEHKNVIAFISHCGLGGMNEAVYTATPVVACPIFADQLDNAEILEDREVAVHLDINDITKENILNALNAIINDTRYYEKMQKFSKVFKDRPMTPQQTVVYWTEYVIRHNGASHLKNPLFQWHWFQYYFLDVICVVILLLVFPTYLIVRFFKLIFLRYFRVDDSKPKNKKL